MSYAADQCIETGATARPPQNPDVGKKSRKKECEHLSLSVAHQNIA